MSLGVILLLIALFVFTGGGFYSARGPSPYYAGGNHIGLVGIILIVIVVVYALRGGTL